MSDSVKICPICQTTNASEASYCSNCGTSIREIAPLQTETSFPTASSQYYYAAGEADLMEQDLRQSGRLYLTGCAALVVLIFLGGLLFLTAPTALSNLRNISLPFMPGDTDTPTPRPTMTFPTLTPGPPTGSPTSTPPPPPSATPEPTRGPCIQTVLSGDTLLAMIARCGHRHADVIDEVLQINNLPSAISIQPNQEIEIPWPTNTPDPNNVDAEPPPDSIGEDGTPVGQLSAFDQNFDPDFIPTETLQPGLMYHFVQPNENIISIAVDYGANVEIISQLNPEIQFSQCDFGETYGGPRCNVLLNQGQKLRVPAPTSTPTLPPTATGNETATPSATPTFNAPVPDKPDDRAYFTKDQLITLRWTPSGTLGSDEIYQVRVEDVTLGVVYMDSAQTPSFVIPETWRGTAQNRHEYSWSVSVVKIDTPDSPLFMTDSHVFFWQGKESE